VANVRFSARIINGGGDIKLLFHKLNKNRHTAVFPVLFVFEAVFLIESIDAAIGLSESLLASVVGMAV
jgi:hypothetical protein